MQHISNKKMRWKVAIDDQERRDQDLREMLLYVLQQLQEEGISLRKSNEENR